MNKILKYAQKSGVPNIPGIEEVQDCMDVFSIVPSNILSFIGEFSGDVSKKGGTIYDFLKFIFSVVMFICVFPALPFFFVMALMISSIKYLFFKLRKI
jgi:hypothetical protein